MNMKRWWNNIGRRKSKYWRKSGLKCRVFHHRGHTRWPGIKAGTTQWKTD